MHGYVCFYKGKKLEVTANSSYEAQVQSAHTFKAKKAYEVTVVLCESYGKQVTLNTASI
jgi:F0F1-type ATP synthase delta subunit